MGSMIETAKEFITACETGKGWEGCKQAQPPFSPTVTRLSNRSRPAGVTTNADSVKSRRASFDRARKAVLPF